LYSVYVNVTVTLAHVRPRMVVGLNLGKMYLHVAKAPHFWNIKGIVDVRGRTFMI